MVCIIKTPILWYMVSTVLLEDNVTNAGARNLSEFWVTSSFAVNFNWVCVSSGIRISLDYQPIEVVTIITRNGTAHFVKNFKHYFTERITQPGSSGINVWMRSRVSLFNFMPSAILIFISYVYIAQLVFPIKTKQRKYLLRNNKNEH